MSENIKILSPDKDIKITKWIVHRGSQVSNGSVLLLYHEKDLEKPILRLKITNCGIVKKLLHKEGDIVVKSSPLLEIAECLHTTILLDLCAECGADLQQIDMVRTSKASVRMIHSVPELKVSEELAKKLGKADTNRLLVDRKLALLVDLDQTIIHTTNDNVPNNLKDVYHFQLYGPSSPWFHTRLRPGTLDFLKTITKHYELHICTFGARNYAHMICGFLDENGSLFSQRILSRDECLNATNKKDNLKALFPDECGDSMVCIIDDREDVWNYAKNLIQVKPYHFFQHTGDINAPPNLAKRELDGEGVDFNKIVKLQKANNKTKIQIPKKKITTTTTTTENNDTKITQEKPSLIEMEPVKNDIEEMSKDEVMKEVVSIAEEKTNDVEKEENNIEMEVDAKTEIDKKPDESEMEQDENQEPIEMEQDPVESEKPLKNDDKKAVATSTAALEDKMAKTASSEDKENKDDNLVEIQDPDDYLLYLETILERIHERFYEQYDKTNEIPDMKVLIPQLKSEILVGIIIVFSGLVPNNAKLEHSRPFLVAKNLGAKVQSSIDDETTHLVAVSTGTQKVFQAQKSKKISIVTPDWLWTCAERWEHVEEKLFPLTANRTHKMRQVPAHCSPERINEESERPDKFNNPFLQMSDDDIAEMEAEVTDSSSDTDSDDEREDTSDVEKVQRKRKRSHDEGPMSSKILHTIDISGKGTVKDNGGEDEDSESDSKQSGSKSSDSETPVIKFRRGEKVSDIDTNESSENTDEDGEWNTMGAELEKGFLDYDDE